MANLNFDATQVKPQASFEALPAGWYLVAIVASENKDTKAGTGKYLQLTLEVLEGDYKGRKVFDRLNLENPNQQAVEIAKATLSSICHAIDVLTPQDSSELHDRPMLAKVSVREYEGDKQNEVKGYKAQGSGSNGAAKNGATKNGAKKKSRKWQPNRLKRDAEAQQASEESGDEYEGDDADE